MFSIVIPLYNKQYSIVKCLNSVFSQKFNDFEIIIVNDGSTDNSLELVKEIIINNIGYDIKLINQKNQGVSVARNVGIEKSKYDFICFLDADDNWEPDFLNIYKNYISSYEEAGIWISGYRVNDALDSVMYDKEGYIDCFFDISVRKTILHTSAVCSKRSILLDIGGFPEGEKVGEDLYVWARIAEKYKFCYIPHCLVNVIQEKDLSRSGRDMVNSYILEYYSHNREALKNKKLKKYLIYIYFVHLAEVISRKNYKAFLRRWMIGLSLFPYIAISLFLPSLLPFSMLRKMKNFFRF